MGTHAINERTCTHINTSIPLERSPLKHITGPILLNNFPVFAHAHNCRYAMLLQLLYIVLSSPAQGIRNTMSTMQPSGWRCGAAMDSMAGVDTERGRAGCLGVIRNAAEENWRVIRYLVKIKSASAVFVRVGFLIRGQRSDGTCPHFVEATFGLQCMYRIETGNDEAGCCTAVFMSSSADIAPAFRRSHAHRLVAHCAAPKPSSRPPPALARFGFFGCCLGGRLQEQLLANAYSYYRPIDTV